MLSRVLAVSDYFLVSRIVDEILKCD